MRISSTRDIIIRNNYFDGDRFVHEKLARELMKDLKIKTAKIAGRIYVYDPESGIWQDGDQMLKTAIQIRLGKESTERRHKETIYYLRNATLVDDKELVEPSNFIPLMNGIFDLNREELIPYSPDHFFTFKHPFPYEPTATCPITDAFYSRLGLDDGDLEAIHERNGYTLIRDRTIKDGESFIFYGIEDTGKSAAIKHAQKFVGEENTTALSLQKLAEDRFASAELFNKSLNLCADLPKRPIKDNDFFKSATGGDLIPAELKFGKKFYFKPYVKLIFSCNSLPRTKDTTTAYFTRWRLVPFKRQFLQGDPERDPYIIEKISTPEELSGYFNLILPKLKALLKSGAFTGSATAQDTMAEYIRESDPTAAFIFEYLKKDRLGTVKKEDAYAKYLIWCNLNDVPPLKQNAFGSKVVEIHRAIPSTERNEEKRPTIYRGISWAKEPPELETEPTETNEVDVKITDYSG